MSSSVPRRVLLAGATGYIGRHVALELQRRGHTVVALARRRAGVDGRATEDETRASLPGVEVRFCEVSVPVSLRAEGLQGEGFDAVVSCLASRTGAPADARAIDGEANLQLLEAAGEAGARNFVLLSALCVQRPRLAFQHEKLRVEAALQASGLAYSIVRPTAFFKSLAGQVRAVQRGRPFVMFGDGALTRCKPIAEEDLACFLADCLDDPQLQGRVLPIGGPGPAITPRQQGELLFRLVGRPPRFRRVPVALLDGVIAALAALGRVVPSLADRAELARIGRYYATESMLVWDDARGCPDEAATPSYGARTLEDFYRRVLAEGLAGQELGAAAVFDVTAASPRGRERR